MGSDWQNPYLPSLVNAAFTLMLKKNKTTLFLNYSTLEIIW